MGAAPDGAAPAQPPDGEVADHGADDGAVALCPLPTMQRHALCKLFERADFSAAEVAALGLRQLRRASGLGPKGLALVQAWLAGQGMTLAETPAGRRRGASDRQRVAQAIRMLERLGYEVRPPPAREP